MDATVADLSLYPSLVRWPIVPDSNRSPAARCSRQLPAQGAPSSRTNFWVRPAGELVVNTGGISTV